MRYDNTLTAFVLKQQPIGEADVLVTWYTKEQGKIRSIATSARRFKSRLAFALIPASIVSIRLVARGAESTLFKLAGASHVKNYLQDYTEDQALLLAWMLEVLIKSTPDAEPNEQLFIIAERFFAILPSATSSERAAPVAVHCLLHILSALGVAIREENLPPSFFTVQGGGFFIETDLHDKTPISPQLWNRYESLKRMKLDEILELPYDLSMDAQLLSLFESFFEYHLERPIRSFRFLGGIMK